MELSFAKLCPGGNPTILVTDPVPAADRAALSARLMDPLHLSAEQVGFLSQNGPLPRLDMMGGEFCVNATRAAAFLLALEKRLTWNGLFWQGEMEVSGMPTPVPVVAALKGEAFLPLVTCGSMPDQREAQEPEILSTLYCAAMLPCDGAEPGETARMIQVDRHAVLVHLPGISHLLLDAAEHPLPDDWKAGAAAWRKRAGINDLPAGGVVWYERRGNGFAIHPVVHVAATASVHMETACGSASLALALLDKSHNPALPRPSGTPVSQPSGDILTVFTPQDASNHGAWVSGIVRLAARGTAFL